MAMYGRFTERAQRALAMAQEEARNLGQNYVGTEHLLLGLLRDPGSVATRALGNAAITADAVREQLIRLVGKGDFKFTEAFGYTPRTKKVLDLSLYEARNLGHNYVGVEHLMLALIREQEGVAARVLIDMGVDMKKARESLMAALSSGEDSEGAPSGGTPGAIRDKDLPVLAQYGRDLTRAAQNGDLDPVIGRSKEIERIIQILSRRQKNNPALIGEPGVGKTAVVEGLAQHIAEGNVPEMLKGKRVVMLDLSGMLAGAKYRGEFEERLKNAMEEIRKAGNIILFIDEMHTIIGAGAAEGAIDASNIIKPALARGEMQAIGATTIDEYRKHVEKDPALERRFQPVTVGEPSREEAVAILKGLRDKYEAHHKVRITDEAIEAAVALSDRYITDRFLPDKAVDLIDEACSRVRIQNYTAPPDMKELETRMEALSKEKEEAIRNQDFEKAASVRDDEQQLQKQMEQQRTAWEGEKQKAALSIGEDDIATIVSSWTNIPVKRLTEDESARLLGLEETLHKRVIGQHDAVAAVARAVRRSRAGLKDPKRPTGSFIFLGPTGVGKTELCRALGETLFGDEDAVVRIDMSEYMEKHAVSRMIGSPPGYVGHEEGGQLTEKVRRKPYSVVLFDEIEKAHPDVFNILLQILEDGRLTDSKGRTVDFRNTILVMTSNVGASSIKKQQVMGFGASVGDRERDYEKMKLGIMEELKKTFKPEFLNRVDEIIVFHELQQEHIRSIVDIMLAQVQKRLAERGIHLQADDSARDHLSAAGFDPVYGARPLRRAIQRQVEDALSEEILAGRVAIGDLVCATAGDGKLIFRKEDEAKG